jgi:GNAT superfamily N-acetyltransferase
MCLQVVKGGDFIQVTNSSVLLRGLGKDDFEDWKALWRMYLDFYETHLPEEVYEKTFERLLSKDLTSQNAIVAMGASKTVGLVHFIFHPHNWKIEDVCYLQDLYVSDTVRGQGIGRLLIEAVYDEADKRGVPTVYWLTQDFNKPARLLYDKIATLTPFIKYNR